MTALEGVGSWAEEASRSSVYVAAPGDGGTTWGELCGPVGRTLLSWPPRGVSVAAGPRSRLHLPQQRC